MRKKCSRGGQPGNQNARKHGFYSSSMSQPEIRQLLNILDREDIDRVVAIIRVKLKTALRLAPGNRRLLRETSRLLAKLYASKYECEGAEKTEFKKGVRYIFENAAENLQFQSALVKAKKDDKKITKRVEAKSPKQPQKIYKTNQAKP